MTIYMHDKPPKKGMLQAAKEQGWEEAMQRVDALEGEVAKLRAWLGDSEMTVAKLRAALEPFARKVDAVSLSGALGHIKREHLWAARAALEETK